jgi:hypothetical protein
MEDARVRVKDHGERDGARDRPSPPVPAPSGRLRHLRRGNEALNRDRRPPREARIRRAVELVLGEDVGGLVADLLDQTRRGELPPQVARVLLDRLLPPPPPRVVDLGLPDIRPPADLEEAKRLVTEALNDGRVSIAEWRELQEGVYQSWRLHQAAVTAG